MTKEELKNCYPGDWVWVTMWTDRSYECQIIRFEDYDKDGLPDKAMVAGPIMTIVKPESLSFIRHDPRIQQLIDSARIIGKDYYTSKDMAELKDENDSLKEYVERLKDVIKKTYTKAEEAYTEAKYGNI